MSDKRLDAFEEVLQRMQDKGDELATIFQAGRSFSHIVIDNLFDPSLLERINTDFPDPGKRDWFHWKSRFEDKTTSKGIEGLSAFTQDFFNFLNSHDFITQLKKISGYDDLEADTSFFGAGLQETFRDGWLNAHVDYTRHPHLALTRRLSLYVYLNRDWKPEWRGDLELWDYKTRKCVGSYAPLFNRLILIPATPDALHGQPAKLACPKDRSRRFVSVTYWTADQLAAQSSTGIKWLFDDGRLLGPP